jgi:hypothetical protein
MCRHTKQGITAKKLNQSLTNRDKMKDDAIAHLSECLLAIPKDYRRLSENNRQQYQQ